MSVHTPGPWKAVARKKDWAIKNGSGCTLALVPRWDATMGQYPLGPQCEGNAKLIAAAPELAARTAAFLNWFATFMGADAYAEINAPELNALIRALQKVEGVWLDA
jgi:hypothetical protein